MTVHRWTSVMFGMVALLCASDAAAQCKRNEVQVGEDEDAYYCKDKKEYAACVKSAGEALRASNPACARTVEECFRSEKKGLKTAAAGCVLGCLASSPILPGCLAACGMAGLYGSDVLDRCADTYDTCFAGGLTAHRRHVDNCKR